MSGRFAVRSTRPLLGKWAMRTGQGPIKTRGHLRNCEVAFVYVGVGKRGRVKIGMSADPEKRCRDLSIALHYAVPVAPAVAKEIETQALASFGHGPWDGEWTTQRTADEAAEAVRQAFAAVARYRRACPYQTEEDARLWRISVASAKAIP